MLPGESCQLLSPLMDVLQLVWEGTFFSADGFFAVAACSAERSVLQGSTEPRLRPSMTKKPPSVAEQLVD